MVDIARREDAMLDTMSRLMQQRRSAIRVCVAYKLAFPDLTIHMDWVLAALEATEGELERA